MKCNYCGEKIKGNFALTLDWDRLCSKCYKIYRGGGKMKIEIDIEDFSEYVTPELIQETAKNLADVMVKKNKDYGGAGYTTGLFGNYIHLTDKYFRIKSLLFNIYNKEKKPNFESLGDSYLDLAGRSIMGYIIWKLQEERRKESAQNK